MKPRTPGPSFLGLLLLAVASLAVMATSSDGIASRQSTVDISLDGDTRGAIVVVQSSYSSDDALNSDIQVEWSSLADDVTVTPADPKQVAAVQSTGFTLSGERAEIFVHLDGDSGSADLQLNVSAYYYTEDSAGPAGEVEIDVTVEGDGNPPPAAIFSKLRTVGAGGDVEWSTITISGDSVGGDAQLSAELLINTADLSAVRLYDAGWNLIDLTDRTATLSVPSPCERGPCEIQLHLVEVAPSSWYRSGNQFSIRQTGTLPERRFVASSERSEIIRTDQTIDVGLVTVGEQPQSLGFDIELPSPADGPTAAALYTATVTVTVKTAEPQPLGEGEQELEFVGQASLAGQRVIDWWFAGDGASADSVSEPTPISPGPTIAEVTIERLRGSLGPHDLDVEFTVQLQTIERPSGPVVIQRRNP
jgi:hypothetical protein